MIIFLNCSTLLLGQFNYIDINPDSVFTATGGQPTEVSIDLNSDSIPDFKVSTGVVSQGLHGHQVWNGIIGMDSNLVIADSNHFAFELAYGDSVSLSQEYRPGGTLLNGSTWPMNSWSGYWQNNGPAMFCGIKFYGNGNWYYGWIILSVKVQLIPGALEAETVLYEYCYSTFPLSAGNCHTPLNINELVSPSVNIYPNPTQNYFTIEGISKPFNLSIFNTLGQLIYTENDVSDSSKMIDISRFSKGLLFLKIAVGNEVITRKIIKE